MILVLTYLVQLRIRRLGAYCQLLVFFQPLEFPPRCSLDSTLLCSNVEHAALARLVPSTFALQLAAPDLGKETLKVKKDEGGGSRPNFSSRRRLEIDFGTCLNNDMSNEHQDVTTIHTYPCWDVQAEMGRLAVQLVAPFLSTKELINWRTACVETSQTYAFVEHLVSLVDPSAPEVFVAAGDFMQISEKHEAKLEQGKLSYHMRERCQGLRCIVRGIHFWCSACPKTIDSLVWNMRNHCFSANNHNIASKAQRFAILFARHLLEQSLAPNVQHLLVPDLLRILSEGFEKEQIAVC